MIPHNGVFTLSESMQLVWVERATRPFSAATCRRVERTTITHHSVRAWCARLLGGSPDRTGRWPVPPGTQPNGSGLCCHESRIMPRLRLWGPWRLPG